ncbi:MAG TPA: hypothetical protein VE011_07825 [Candidatus Dormibacteraeota bacterium]|nr:hypothetical protein [Candidatus Dormibacteraeota bacterium]
MGIDTTPGSKDGDSDGRDYAPWWVLLLGVVIVVLGVLWVLVSFFNMSGPA